MIVIAIIVISDYRSALLSAQFAFSLYIVATAFFVISLF